jgi:hypothetical protein
MGLAGEQMRNVFFVFDANIIQQLGVRRQRLVQFDGPWPGIRLGIVHCDLDLYFPEGHPTESFRNCGGVG